MVRKLKFHEQKLLKKVDFISWEVDNNLHEVKVMRRFHIQRREDYTKYNKLSRHVRDLARSIKELDIKDPFRTEATSQLLEKLYNMGLIPTKASLELADKVNATSFCRRRLPVVMAASHMAETIKNSSQFIQQGHVRVGPEVVKDPAFLVTRNMEDFITWTDTSAIRKHVLDYNELKLEESINKVIENGEKMLQEIRGGRDQKSRIESKAKGSSTSNIDLKYKALHTNVTNVGYLLRKSSDKKTSATDESEIMYELKAQMMKNLDVQNTRLKTELNLHERLNEVRLLQQENLRLQNECTMSRANTHKLMKMFERKAIEANDKLAEMQKKLEKYEKCLKNHGILPDTQSTEKMADNHKIEDTQKNSNDLPNSQDLESTKNRSKDDQTKNTNDDNIQSVTDDNVENSIENSIENLKVDNENDENYKSKQRPFTRGKSAAKKLAENGFTSKMDELARKNENMSHENGELRREIQRLKYDNTVLIRRIKFTTTNHSTLVNSLSTSESSRVNMVKKLKKEKQQNERLTRSLLEEDRDLGSTQNLPIDLYDIFYYDSVQNERLTRSLTRQTADWVQSRRLVQQMEEDYRWEQVGPIPTGGPQFRIPHLPTSKNIYMPRKGADTERSYTIST